MHRFLPLVLSALAVVLPALPASSDSARDTRSGQAVLTLEDTFELETVADPQISPDGKRVVYVRAFADVMTDRRYSNLWIVNFDGSGHRPLTSGKRNDGSPRWSPSGDRLAFVSVADGEAQIHMRWMDSGTTQVVTRVRKTPSSIVWSPDGTQIAFLALVPSAPKTVGKMPSKPAGADWAPPARMIDQPVYRFDQVGYLETGFTHVFVVPAEGGTPRQISSGDFEHRGRFRSGYLAWTPDGKHLLVAGKRRDDAWRQPLNSEIYEFDVASGDVRALTDRVGPDEAPAISPDGKKIAYLGFDDRYQGYQLTQLYVMNRDGSDSEVISRKLDRSVGNPTWTGDGKAIVATYVDRGVVHLARFGLDGKVQTIATGLGGRGSAYAGGAFSLAPGGEYAFAWADSQIPSDVAVGHVKNDEAQRITAVNDDVLGHKTLGAVEEVRYKSSLDGREIHGWVITPPGFDASKKYPLILEIHGGPFAAYGPGFDLEKQLMAAGGYVVLYTNPRGSTSYGQAFGNLIHHAYPGDDFFDLNSGVDALVAKGYVDPEQLYVTGGSGGGVLTSWMVGRTERFRAAVTVYPVINWYSWVLTADITAFGIRYWFPGPPWEHAEHYEKRSLLSVVGNVTTPTMVLTGEEDWRTPMSESEQYYQALQWVGVESALVRVPGEPHGIRRRPSHHAQKLAYIIGWFDKYRGEE